MLKYNKNENSFTRISINSDCLPRNDRLNYSLKGVYAYADHCKQAEYNRKITAKEKAIANESGKKEPNLNRIAKLTDELQDLEKEYSTFQTFATCTGNNWTDHDKVVSVAFFGCDYEKPSSMFENLYNMVLAYDDAFPEKSDWTDERKKRYRNIKSYMLEGTNLILGDNGFQKLSGKHVDKFIFSVCPDGYATKDTKNGRSITDRNKDNLTAAHRHFYMMVVALCGGYIGMDRITGKEKAIARF